MAPSIPAPLCKLIMPATGQRCGSPALRGQPYCYHHSGNHRELTQEHRIMQRLEHLHRKLDEMDTTQLLHFLSQQLGGLARTLTRFPEVGYTLTYVLEHIEEITSFESALREMVQLNQELNTPAQAAPNSPMNMHATHAIPIN